MKLRIFLAFLAVFIFNACHFFTADDKKNRQELDTIVDFSSVDVSPTFINCESLIEKEEQNNCFGNTIQQKIGEELAAFSLEVKNPIDEIITVIILINLQGEFLFQELKASEIIKNEIPKLDSILKVSVENLPTVYPAIKRSIPVATQYELPIRIKLEE